MLFVGCQCKILITIEHIDINDYAICVVLNNNLLLIKLRA